MIGTNLDPAKNDNAFGNMILWKRLCNAATPRPTIIPPNTPICNVLIPQTEATVPSNTFFAMEPSSRILPLIFSIALIEIFITKNAITADNAATSFSFLAIPIATPTANNNGKLSNTALPTLFMITSSACNIVPFPNIPPK